MTHPGAKNESGAPPAARSEASRLAIVEALSELLVDALPIALPAALRLILHSIDRPGGLLLIKAQGKDDAPLVITHQVPAAWEAQAGDASSSLYQVGQQYLASAKPAPVRRPGLPLELAAAVPLETRFGAAGVLLVHGAPCTPAEADWLRYLAGFLGRAVRSGRPLPGDLAAMLASTRQALLDAFTGPTYIVDREYGLTAANAACVDPGSGMLLARAGAAGADAWPSRRCYEVLYGRQEVCPGCRAAETLANGQGTQRLEHRGSLQAGDLVDRQISTYAIADESGRTVQVIVAIHDVTEKRRLEALLAQSEKLAAIGQLAAGVAHEINNPLAAIVANTQLLQRGLGPEEDLQESLDLIARASDRALKIVGSLLDFARQDRYEFVPTDVNESLRDAITLIEHQFFTHSITVESDLADDLPRIWASHDHLQGVWLNLLLNARDALDSRSGLIRVTSGQHTGEIRVSIGDNGSGIDPGRLTRIFEPFYTTKEAGRGTGLGLSLCQRIVQRHGGQIRVESQVGQGSVFTVVLPVQSPTPLSP